MEKSTKHPYNNLYLTTYCFEILLEQIFQKLGREYPNVLNTGVSQRYGFGSFDTNLPSLKKALENVSGSFVNGKYLYDKYREIKSGKPTIKLNGPYRSILFQYLGYNEISDFLADHIKDEKELQKQLAILHEPEKSQTYYYVSYHFGEYREIVKAQVIVRDNWRTIEYKYLYPDEDNVIKEFLYYGTIKKRADALHIQTRTLMDGKMVDGGENILYIGYGDPAKSKFILGVYSAFDINNRLIAGKLIKERCSSKEEMERSSLEKKVPGYIAQEIRNMRIENEINIPNNKLEISKNSPYYLTYEGLGGEFKFSFESHANLSDLSFFIDPNTYKITCLDPSVLINKDEIELLQNGSILHFSFRLTGLAPFLQLDIYVKTYYLSKKSKGITGVFCGVDFENRLVNGNTTITFSPFRQNT